jgi:hypothetical protein
MVPTRAAVSQDGGIVAPGFLQGVAEDRKPVESSVVVDALGQTWDAAVVSDKPQRVAGR